MSTEGLFEHEGSLFQLYIHFDRVMVGEDEALIKGVHGEKLHIGGDDKSVNEIVLRGFVIRVIGLIVQTCSKTPGTHREGSFTGYFSRVPGKVWLKSPPAIT